MKVLVINGSPRDKGNSDLLCDEFIRGAREAGHQVEKISLRSKTINPCKACYACFRTDSCIQKDDMAGILENLGDRVCQVIWGEHVWQKGEVTGTKAMEEAYLAGRKIGA